MESRTGQILWFESFYDGPLDGLAMCAGRRYWFCVDDSTEWHKVRPRQYLLYELTDDELAECDAAHEADRMFSERWDNESGGYFPPDDRQPVAGFVEVDP